MASDWSHRCGVAKKIKAGHSNAVRAPGLCSPQNKKVLPICAPRCKLQITVSQIAAGEENAGTGRVCVPGAAVDFVRRKMNSPNGEEEPNRPDLRIASFAAHATRGLVRHQAMRRRLMFWTVILAVLMLFCGAT